MPGRRRLVPVPEHVAEELARAARETGLTVQELVAMILSHAARLAAGRGDVRALLAGALLLDDLRRLGGAVVPASWLARLAEAVGGEGVEEYWRMLEAAAAAARARGLGEPRAALEALLPAASLDIYREEGGGYRLVAVFSPQVGDGGPGAARLLLGAVEAILRGLGFAVESAEAEGPVLVVRFRARGVGEGGSG